MQIARDILTDCTQDYYFFRYSGTVYFLLTGDGFYFEDGSFYTGDSFHVQELQAILVPSSSPSPAVDSFSGQIIGLEAGVAVEDFSGTYTRERDALPPSYYYITCSYDVDHQLQFTRDAVSDMVPLVYSNLEDCPRLVEGVSYHVGFTNYILLGFVGFLLFHSVFRHIKN